MADVLRRYLSYKGYDVKFVMNLTDVDDKIINKSIKENKEFGTVSEFYINAFWEDLGKLRIKKADLYPKATMHISEMIELISDLEKKGIAYVVDGDVFYNVSKFANYGALSGKNLDDLESGSRVEVNEIKKNPLDFALWKKAKEGEPSWDSPWGKGRPGWHIECSAMSTKHLGNTIDIHAGGNDLIFPHHENEIAQSEAAFNQKFVKYWIHFGFLNIQNEKMSKSLGNFFTARDVLKKYPVEAIRLFFAQTHYRGPLNFSDELLAAAQKGYEKIFNLAERVEQIILKNNFGSSYPQSFEIKNYYSAFEKAMDDDFGTAQAVALIFDFVRDVNTLLAETELPDQQFVNDVKSFLIKTAEEVLGIVHFDSFNKADSGMNLENELITVLLDLRDRLKKEKNYSMADFIREELNKIGFSIQDSKTGPTFKRK